MRYIKEKYGFSWEETKLLENPMFGKKRELVRRIVKMEKRPRKILEP